MNREGYTEFRKKIPVETRIAIEASGSAYAVSKALKDLGYNDITVAHPKELSWITKSGPSVLRYFVVNSVHTLIKLSLTFKTAYRRLKKRIGRNSIL